MPFGVNPLTQGAYNMASEEKKDEDLKLEERPDGTVVVTDPSAEQKKEEPPKDEKLAEGNADEDHEGEGEEQGHAQETAEEAEARRQRNRERRAANKERRKEHIESLKRELAARDRAIAEMNQRLAVVEREAKQFYEHFKNVNAKAVAEADGVLATEAQEKMFAARQRMEQIANIKKAMQAPQQQQA